MPMYLFCGSSFLYEVVMPPYITNISLVSNGMVVPWAVDCPFMSFLYPQHLTLQLPCDPLVKTMALWVSTLGEVGINMVFPRPNVWYNFHQVCTGDSIREIVRPCGDNLEKSAAAEIQRQQPYGSSIACQCLRDLWYPSSVSKEYCTRSSSSDLDSLCVPYLSRYVARVYCGPG